LKICCFRSKKNPNAAIIEFFLSEYGSEDIVVFVEGPDDATFYFDFITTYLPSHSVVFFPCGGKHAVLKVMEFLQSYRLRSGPKKMLFLTDGDLDRYLRRSYPGVFQTDFYSIESYFCSAKFFEYILRKHCTGAIRKKDLIEKLVARFGDNLEQAAKHLLVPMAVICALRESGADIDLDKISCADFVALDADEVCLTKRRDGRRQAFARLLANVEVRPTCAAIRRFVGLFSQDHFNCWLRGKYGLQLMRLILRLLCAEYHQCAAALNRLGFAFGNEALRYGRAFLNDLPALKAYCT
jgi:hypothetical protein